MSIVAPLDGFRRMDFGMLPSVRYTGQADLSPLKTLSWVLSDAMMRGAIAALRSVLAIISYRESEILVPQLVPQ